MPMSMVWYMPPPCYQGSIFFLRGLGWPVACCRVAVGEGVCRVGDAPCPVGCFLVSRRVCGGARVSGWTDSQADEEVV